MSAETIESILEILKNGSLTAIIISGFWIILCYPEKVEKWSSFLWRLIYWVVKRGEKRIVAHDIQGRVNEYAKSLGREIKGYQPVGVKIEWVKTNEREADFFRENRLVIRMKHHEDQNRNFVYAGMALISKTFLAKAKKYLSPTQKESIDLYVGKKLFEKEKPQVAEEFFDKYFSPKALSNDKIIELLEKYNIIDKVGLFYAVLAQELAFLGEKVFFQLRRQEVIAEVANFVRFLEKHAQREVGQEETKQDFEGKYLRCVILIVAKRGKRWIKNIPPYIQYIEKLVANKFENIYLLGSADEVNKSFIDRISDAVEARFKYEKYQSKKYKASIKISGQRKEVRSYLVLLRSRETIRYYDKEYQDEFIASGGKSNRAYFPKIIDGDDV